MLGRLKCQNSRTDPFPVEGEWKAIERGWCLGEEEFRAELLAQVSARRGDHYGHELREVDEAHALKLLRQELKARGWKPEDLVIRRKGDAEKVKIAWRLRRETTMTLKWIARTLQMGSWTYLSNCLVQKRKNVKKNQ